MAVPSPRRVFIFGPDDAACTEFREELLRLTEEMRHRATYLLGIGDLGGSRTCLEYALQIEALTESSHEPTTA